MRIMNETTRAGMHEQAPAPLWCLVFVAQDTHTVTHRWISATEEVMTSKVG